ncbi:hypothetical protein [Streptomyces sp. NPDC001435]|uniref:hypothetical protein n=1 Tax=Streptomyces sp. NPDC001435 TaxID=3364576 RepID=UPI003684DEB6
MTGTDQMLVDEFEQVAAFVEREIETVRLEFLDGRIGLRKASDGTHGTVVMWLVRQWMWARPELHPYPCRGLKAISRVTVTGPTLTASSWLSKSRRTTRTRTTATVW